MKELGGEKTVGISDNFFLGMNSLTGHGLFSLLLNCLICGVVWDSVSSLLCHVSVTAPVRRAVWPGPNEVFQSVVVFCHLKHSPFPP